MLRLISVAVADKYNRLVRHARVPATSERVPLRLCKSMPLKLRTVFSRHQSRRRGGESAPGGPLRRSRLLFRPPPGRFVHGTGDGRAVDVAQLVRGERADDARLRVA